MYPILFSLGPLQIHSLSVFLVLAWCLFSFVFWRTMRDNATPEEATFDLMFYGTMAALVGARAAYVAFHWPEFVGEPLKVAALWVAPGLSLYGGLLVGVATMLAAGRRRKVRMGSVLDALAPPVGGALLMGKIGSLLGATEVGVPTQLPFAVRYAGSIGLRHPIQLYEIGALVVMLVLVVILGRMASRGRWAYGRVGISFFLVYSAVMFGLEFFKESGLYWRGLAANQWVLLALFCEAMGALYVRERARIVSALGGFYERISKRRLG